MGLGYLAAGAVSGAAGEYLKQGDESRAANYQMIRDKRIAGLRKENIGYEAGLRSDEAQRHEGYLSAENEKTATARKTETDADRASREEIDANKPITLGRGQEAYDRDGNLIASGPEYTHANSGTSGPGSAAGIKNAQWLLETVELRGSGKREPMSKLRDQWAKLAYEEFDNPEFPGMGLKITRRNPQVEDFPLWLNAQVVDADHLLVDDPKYMQGDPDALWDYALRTYPGKMNTPEGRAAAMERIKSSPGNEWWTGPRDTSPAGPANPGTEGPNQGAPARTPNPRHNEGPDADAAAAAGRTQAAGTSQNAGLGRAESGTASGMLPPIEGASISVNSRQIAEIEAKIKALEGKQGPASRTRKGLESKLKQLKAEAGQ